MNWHDRVRQILDTSEMVNALAVIQKHSVGCDTKTDAMQSTDVEHAYSVPIEVPANVKNTIETSGDATSTTNASIKATPGPPLIQLDAKTKQKIDDLMMEGDLLEVSLDETQYLWRLYSASKPDITDFDQIRSTYNVKVSCLCK